MGNKEIEIRTAIEAEIRKNKVEFKRRSEGLTVLKIVRVSVLQLQEINRDNIELENYSFSGDIRLEIEDKKTDGGVSSTPSVIRFEGVAKINDTDMTVQITKPIQLKFNNEF